MVYVDLAILGGILFLATAVLDYYWSRIKPQQGGTTDIPKTPSEVPVGSKPPDYRSDSIWSKIPPIYLGYLVAILLELPFLASQLGWI